MPSQGISDLLNGFQSLSMGCKPSKGFPKGFQTFSEDFKGCKARRWPGTIPVASFVLPIRDSTSSDFDFVLTLSCRNWRYLSFVISVFKLLTYVVSFMFFLFTRIGLDSFVVPISISSFWRPSSRPFSFYAFDFWFALFFVVCVCACFRVYFHASFWFCICSTVSIFRFFFRVGFRFDLKISFCFFCFQFCDKNMI